MWAQIDDSIKARIQEESIIYLPSDYKNKPYPVSRALIEDGRNHLLLDSRLSLDCPVHLIQGMADQDVPWQTALAIAEAVTSNNVMVTLIKDGDHRLSRDEDLTRLTCTVDAMARLQAG